MQPGTISAGSATPPSFVIGGSAKLYLAAILDLYSRFISHPPRAARVVCSMSRRGNCYDVIESWFSTVKSEEGERFES